MKLFITLLFCILATNAVISAPADAGAKPPAAKSPTDPSADPSKVAKEKGDSATESVDEKRKDAKDKAKQDVVVGIGEAKLVTNDDVEAAKKLDDFQVKIIEIIDDAGKGAPPTGTPTPVQPPKGA